MRNVLSIAATVVIVPSRQAALRRFPRMQYRILSSPRTKLSVVRSAQVHRTVSYPDAHAASNARLSASDRILTPRSRVTGQLAKRPTERNDIESVTSQPGDPIIMPSYSPELIRTMRAALEQAMTKIPADQATPGIKAHMAEVILKAAAGGQTSYEGLVASASDQIQPILSMLT